VSCDGRSEWKIRQKAQGNQIENLFQVKTVFVLYDKLMKVVVMCLPCKSGLVLYCRLCGRYMSCMSTGTVVLFSRNKQKRQTEVEIATGG
jgi:hypothetical protein